jgi:hypothetical protein
MINPCLAILSGKRALLRLSKRVKTFFEKDITFARMEKITVEWGGLIIMEPMAIVWNWLITIFGVVAYFKLRKNTSPPYKNWSLFFLILGISGFFGGLGHGLFHYWGLTGKILPWTTGILSVYFAERGIYAFIPAEKEVWKKRLQLFSLLKMIIMLAGMAFVSFDFSWTKNNSIIGLTLIVGLGGYLLSRKYKELVYFPIGILVLSSAAFVHGFDINIHPWFNRDDLAHLIMLVGMSFFLVALQKFELKSSQAN